MDRGPLAVAIAVAARLCPSMNGASADRFADALEVIGPVGVDQGLAQLDQTDQRWIEEARAQIGSGELDTWLRLLAELDAEGVRAVTCADDDYPSNLRMIHNRPPFLFVRGTLLPSDSRAVAVVGTRNATDAGIRAATELSQQLTRRDVTVLSGLAAGIDTAAHSAALNAGGRTIAVFGTGIRRTYPRQNRELATAIASSGACVSQFLPDQPGARWTFPVRNITTSGLSLGTVIVEAGPTSGAKLQAHDALRHGKRLFLVRTLVENQEWARELAELPEVTAVDQVDEIVAAIELELSVEPALM